MTFDYRCSVGHEVIGSRSEIDHCPVCVNGQPCAGDVKRTGSGSRTAKKKESQ